MSDSDRYLRGMCWGEGLQVRATPWDEDSGRGLLRRAWSSSSWKTQRSVEDGDLVNDRFGRRAKGMLSPLEAK